MPKQFHIGPWTLQSFSTTKRMYTSPVNPSLSTLKRVHTKLSLTPFLNTHKRVYTKQPLNSCLNMPKQLHTKFSLTPTFNPTKRTSLAH